ARVASGRRHQVQRIDACAARLRTAAVANRNRERKSLALAHEPGGALPHLRRDVVERAPLVVGTPLSPVAQRAQQGLELDHAHELLRKWGITCSPKRRIDSSVFSCGMSQPKTGMITSWSRPTASKRFTVRTTSAGVPTQMPF